MKELALYAGLAIAGAYLLREYDASMRYGVPMFSQQLRDLLEQDGWS